MKNKQPEHTHIEVRRVYPDKDGTFEVMVTNFKQGKKRVRYSQLLLDDIGVYIVIRFEKGDAPIIEEINLGGATEQLHHDTIGVFLNTYMTEKFNNKKGS